MNSLTHEIQPDFCNGLCEHWICFHFKRPSIGTLIMVVKIGQWEVN